MGKATVMLDDKLEAKLRKEHIQRKGDLSRIINESLKQWLDMH